MKGWKFSNFSKDRENEELTFFREIKKREKDQFVNLLDLQPISEDFEPNGNNALYKMELGKKGPGGGIESLAGTGKNDFNWLKTPPATPLFPSLEMEANAPELATQKEIPIIHNLSRFAGNFQEDVKSASHQTPKSPTPRPNPPQRHRTPKPMPKTLPSSSTDKTKTNNVNAPLVNHKMNHSNVISPNEKKNIKNQSIINPKMDLPNKNIKPITTSTSANSSQTPNFHASNLSKIIGGESSIRPKSSRGTSPLVRSAIVISGFSDETPPNLRTNKSRSTSRGRPQNQNFASLSSKPNDNLKGLRRQSCSPSVAQGREMHNVDGGKMGSQSGKVQNAGGQVLGSKMLDKFMNARMSSNEARQDNKMRFDSLSTSERIKMSKSSMDMALKHTEIRGDPSKSAKHGAATRSRKS